MKRLLFVLGVLALFVLDADAQFFRNLVKDAVKEATGVEINSKNSTSARSKQKPDEVSLVVSGQGGTKEEATNRALLSAIEQAYGVYVSANTSILNDDVIKDEIVTVSRGNIKEYKILSENTLSTGGVDVSLSAVVSTSKLISYAQSKGAQTEFAGATFGKEMKIRKLRQENTAKAMNHLLTQLKLMLHNSFDLNLSTSEPQILTINEEEYARKDCRVEVTPKIEVLKGVSDVINSTLGQLALTNSEIEQYDKNRSEYHGFPFQTKDVGAARDLRERKRKAWEYGGDDDKSMKSIAKLECINYYENDIIFYLPITKEYQKEFRRELNNIFMEEFYNLRIVDNLGEVSKFKAWGNYTSFGNSDQKPRYKDKDEGCYECWGGAEEGLVSSRNRMFEEDCFLYYDVHNVLKNYKYFKGTWNFYLVIPMSEIDKYSTFSVEHVPDND